MIRPTYIPVWLNKPVAALQDDKPIDRRTQAPSEVAAEVAAIAVRGLWLKHTYPSSAAMPEREPTPDNRWQRGDVIDALYLA